MDTPVWEGVNKALNSLWRVERVFPHINSHREGEAQYKKGINRRPKVVDIQFVEKLKILEDGSKIEKRLVIIFRDFV